MPADATAPMMLDPVPRVLLVEDDPVSRAFLTAAVEGVPAEVDSADNLAAASALAQAHDYALWLFDAHLADGCGARLLQSLRPHFPHTPALAHTATADSQVHDMLRCAGFLEVLVKPLPATAVQQAVRRALAIGDDKGAGDAANVAPVNRLTWDDDGAARALNGNRVHIATLRGLFVDDLPRVVQHVAAATRGRDLDGARASLHRLRASCGFVGAARLGEAAQALYQRTDSPALLARFEQAAAETLADVAAADPDQPRSTQPAPDQRDSDHPGLDQHGPDQPGPDQHDPDQPGPSPV